MLKFKYRFGRMSYFLGINKMSNWSDAERERTLNRVLIHEQEPEPPEASGDTAGQDSIEQEDDDDEDEEDELVEIKPSEIEANEPSEPSLEQTGDSAAKLPGEVERAQCEPPEVIKLDASRRLLDEVEWIDLSQSVRRRRTDDPLWSRLTRPLKASFKKPKPADALFIGAATAAWGSRASREDVSLATPQPL